jgi:hypothetical protein
VSEVRTIAGSDLVVSRDARRSLARELLEILRWHGVQHLVLRDPDRLLITGLGDLDLWIPAPTLPAARRLLQREAYARGWRLIKKVTRPYVTSLYFCRDGTPPSNLTVDIFPAIRWYALDLIPSRDLRPLGREKDGVVAASPQVAAAVAVLHHLAWSGEVPLRYRVRLRSTDTGHDPFRAMRFARRAVASSSERELRAVRRQLLMQAFVWTLHDRPGGVVHDVVRTTTSLLNSRRGWWIGVEGLNAERSSSHLVQHLKEEHLLVGRWGSSAPAPMNPVRRALWAAKTRLKRRLGATVVTTGSSAHTSADLRIVSRDQDWIVHDGRTARSVDDMTAVTRMVVEALSGRSIDPEPARRRTRRVIGLAGPDGAGKSTLAERLEMDPRLAPTTRFHWRPDVLPPLSGFLRRRTPAPTPTPPSAASTHGAAVSVVRLLYYWLDTQVGFLTRWRPGRRSAGTVLVERTFLDVGADPLRYGFDLPNVVIDKAIRWSFEPDLVIVLDVPGNEAALRKGELPAVEAERQLAWWRGDAGDVADIRLVDASAPIDVVAGRAADIVSAAK